MTATIHNRPAVLASFVRRAIATLENPASTVGQRAVALVHLDGVAEELEDQAKAGEVAPDPDAIHLEDA